MHQYKDHYVSVNKKFLISISLALLWAIFSVWLARFWFGDLSKHLGIIISGFLVFFIAILPGFFNVFMFSSLLLDRRPNRKPLKRYPSISILVAAFNEEKNISDTLLSIYKQHYPGNFEVIVINDGSTDQTKFYVSKLKRKFSWLTLINIKKNQGKALCLNEGLKVSRYPLIVTLDGDSFLYKDALVRIVERFKNDPPNTKAVAGTVMVKNSRENWVTQAQEWDYFHGIATVKRVQSLNHCTLVAQGSFSLYEKKALKEIYGWRDTIGEDIVLTWALLEKNYRIGYCEDSVAFTVVPNTFLGWLRQRRRWARGMLEAFQYHPSLLFKPSKTAFFVWIDFFFPFIDFAFTFGFIPGIIAACFGYFWIVGLITLSLIPVAFLLNWIMYTVESNMYKKQNLHVRKNILGFFIYTVFYSIVMQPITLAGYFYEVFGARKIWGVK